MIVFHLEGYIQGWLYWYRDPYWLLDSTIWYGTVPFCLGLTGTADTAEVNDGGRGGERERGREGRGEAEGGLEALRLSCFRFFYFALSKWSRHLSPSLCPSLPPSLSLPLPLPLPLCHWISWTEGRNCVGPAPIQIGTPQTWWFGMVPPSLVTLLYQDEVFKVCYCSEFRWDLNMWVHIVCVLWSCSACCFKCFILYILSTNMNDPWNPYLYMQCICC